MAIVSSHTLNATDGTHAGGIRVCLRNLHSGAVLFDTTMDVGGRLSETIDILGDDPDADYELCFFVGPYWNERGFAHGRIMSDITLRFSMPDADARYHLPIILSPNGYSCWVSVPEHRG